MTNDTPIGTSNADTQLRNTLPATGFARLPQIIPGVVPISPATLWRWVKNKQFPAPVKLGDRITAWRCEEIHAWISSRSNKSK